MNKEIEFKTFEVKKNEWSSSRFVSETFNGNLEQDQVLLKIDRFALTTMYKWVKGFGVFIQCPII